MWQLAAESLESSSGRRRREGSVSDRARADRERVIWEILTLWDRHGFQLATERDVPR